MSFFNLISVNVQEVIYEYFTQCLHSFSTLFHCRSCSKLLFCFCTILIFALGLRFYSVSRVIVLRTATRLLFHRFSYKLFIGSSNTLYSHRDLFVYNLSKIKKKFFLNSAKTLYHFQSKKTF